MGNLLTVIGTVSTLVVGNLLVASGHETLGFLSVTPFGLASLALAIAWFLLVGRRLLPREIPPETQRPSLDEVEQAYRLDRMLYRLRVRSGSDLIAQRLDQSPLSKREIIRRLGTSPAQFYRLLDTTNYRKSVDKVLMLLHVLDCEVDLVVRSPRAMYRGG